MDDFGDTICIKVKCQFILAKSYTATDALQPAGPFHKEWGLKLVSTHDFPFRSLCRAPAHTLFIKL